VVDIEDSQTCAKKLGALLFNCIFVLFKIHSCQNAAIYK